MSAHTYLLYWINSAFITSEIRSCTELMTTITLLWAQGRLTSAALKVTHGYFWICMLLWMMVLISEKVSKGIILHHVFNVCVFAFYVNKMHLKNTLNKEKMILFYCTFLSQLIVLLEIILSLCMPLARFGVAAVFSHFKMVSRLV